MKTPVVLAGAVFLIGCAPSIKRIGYSRPEKVIHSCPMEFSKPNQTTQHGFIKLGEVKVKDSGFTFECTESEILDIIRSETCSMGGNVAVIRKERRPDWLSTCFRAEADILKVSDSTLAQYKSEYYKKEGIELRARVQSGTQSFMLIGAVVGGILLGFSLSR